MADKESMFCSLSITNLKNKKRVWSSPDSYRDFFTSPHAGLIVYYTIALYQEKKVV